MRRLLDQQMLKGKLLPSFCRSVSNLVNCIFSLIAFIETPFVKRKFGDRFAAMFFRWVCRVRRGKQRRCTLWWTLIKRDSQDGSQLKGGLPLRNILTILPIV